MSLIGLVHIRTGKDFETIDRYFDLCSRDLKKSSLTHFQPMFHFYTPRKHQKISGFLMFSGDIEVEHWLKMD